MELYQFARIFSCPGLGGMAAILAKCSRWSECYPGLETGLGDYFRLYDHKRPHQSLDYRTPAEVHFDW